LEIAGSDMTELSRSLRAGTLLHEISRLRRSVFDHALRPHGITRAQSWILSSLMQSGREGMTQSELAKLVDISRVALGEFVDRLESLGYVVRMADLKDRRVNRLKLTATGEEVVKKTRTVGDSIEEKINSGFTPEEQAAFETMLHKLKRNLLSVEYSSSTKASKDSH
jgi:MarR family transcriptional regulator, transcriptional regulator for hemolysin